MSLYKGHSEMIWTHLICSNFIIFTHNTNQLLTQHIPILDYTKLPSPWKLLGGFTEPFFRGAVILLTDRHLCSFLATSEAPQPI
jgi:hypothetical protein